MLFVNRAHAGTLLAKKLEYLRGSEDILVLALPRGGVPVAFEISKVLGLPLDTLIVRKLGVPEHEELAMGAIASGGVKVLNRDLIDRLGISEKQLAAVIRLEEIELARRENLYRKERPPLQLANKWIVLVDDGLATGSTMLAAVRALHQSHVKKITVAVPVAPDSAVSDLEREVDEIVCLQKPTIFGGVGASYYDFSQTTDEEVKDLLGN